MNTERGLHEVVYRPESLPRMQRLHFTTVPSETYEGSGNDAEQTVSFIFTRRPELQLMCHSMKPAMVIFSRGKGAKPVETLVIKNDFPKPPWGELAGKQHPKTKKTKAFLSRFGALSPWQQPVLSQSGPPHSYSITLLDKSETFTSQLTLAKCIFKLYGDLMDSREQNKAH